MAKAFPAFWAIVLIFTLALVWARCSVNWEGELNEYPIQERSR